MTTFFCVSLLYCHLYREFHCKLVYIIFFGLSFLKVNLPDLLNSYNFSISSNFCS